MKKRYLAVDPGREKCGLAIVNEEGQAQWLQILNVDEFETRLKCLLVEGSFNEILLGSGTGKDALLKIFHKLMTGKKIIIVDEKNTTLLGRELYWQYNPPKNWKRLLPEKMRPISEPIDCYAALAIALRWLQENK